MDSTSKSSSSSNVASKRNNDEENSPLWRYINRLKKTGDGGGT